MNTFSIAQALAAGWDAIKRKSATVIAWGALVGVFQATIFLLFPAEVGVKGVLGTSFLVNFFGGIVLTSIIVYIETVLSLCILRGTSLTSTKNWRLHLLPTVVVATLLFFLALIAGLLAFIVPGLIFIAVYSMFAYVIVDKEVGIVASFRESARLTKGARWKVLALATGTMVVISLTIFLGDSLKGLTDSVMPSIIVSYSSEMLYGIISLALSLVSADAYLQLAGRSASDSGQ